MNRKRSFMIIKYALSSAQQLARPKLYTNSDHFMLLVTNKAS